MLLSGPVQWGAWSFHGDLALINLVAAPTNALIGYVIAYDRGQLFREGLFQFMTSFSLPWYAIVGAKTAVEAGIPVAGALVIAVPTGVYRHTDGRPLLGRKLAGKSARELRDLGLLPDPPPGPRAE